MKKVITFAALLTILGVIGLSCDAPTTPLDPQQGMVSVQAGSMASMNAIASSENRNFSAHCSGDEEVPPRDTRAQGQANFKLSQDGGELEYKLIVANIENVVASHIHLGQAGVNGPIVAFLAGNFSPGGGRTDGVLAEGTITAANLIGPLTGQPLSALINAMEAGNTYVNVHTNDGVPPTNTGPGDFPGGEVRGQIR